MNQFTSKTYYNTWTIALYTTKYKEIKWKGRKREKKINEAKGFLESFRKNVTLLKEENIEVRK